MNIYNRDVAIGVLGSACNNLNLLRDRNLIAHTYKEDIAIEIHDRIAKKHIKTLSSFIEKFDKKIESFNKTKMDEAIEIDIMI